MPTSFPNAESDAVKPMKILNPMHAPMLNPRNYPVSCRQMLLGFAGLPWTLSLMRMSRTVEQGTLLVLCYHRITESVSSGGFCDSHYFITLPKRVFLSQIRWLTRHYRVVGLDEVLSGRPLPPKTALITFDDGFRDVAETAFPILRSFGLPATVFLIGSVIRENKIPWITRLHWLLDHAREKGADAGCLDILGVEAQNGNNRKGGIPGMLASLKTLLKHKDIHEIEDHLACLEEKLGAKTPPDLLTQRFMNHEQIARLAGHGWTVGNHTDHHLNLASLEDRRVREEIAYADNTLAALPGYRPVLALPFGLAESFTQATVDIARRCGMRHVLTSLGSPNRFPGQGILLDRVICETFSGLYFRFVASGGRKAVKSMLDKTIPSNSRRTT